MILHVSKCSMMDMVHVAKKNFGEKNNKLKWTICASNSILLNTKVDVLKNITVAIFHTMEVDGEQPIPIEHLQCIL